MGEEPNHRPRGSLVLFKSLNTLWWEGWWGYGKEKTAMRKIFLRIREVKEMRGADT
jgi:hypothetical protein